MCRLPGDLASVIAPGGAVGYAADGDGLRQTRTVGGATAKLMWDTVSALPLLLDDGSAAYVYGPGGTPVEQVATGSGAVSYLHADNLGSVRAVTDAGGAVIGTADYDAFGRRTTTGAVTAVGFTGNLTDPVTGLVYLRARDYDPATGQFLRVDPLVDQTRQPYAYTGNNPLAATDPTGLCTDIAAHIDHEGPCTPDDFQPGASFLLSPEGLYLGDIMKSSSSGLFGFADTITFGGTKAVRQILGVECQFEIDEFQYGAGGVAAIAATFALPGGPVAGLLKAERAAREASVASVIFGHGARHLAETRLGVGSAPAVERAITSHVAEATHGASTGSFWGRIVHEGTTIEYRAYTVAEKLIKIGTYYAPKR